MIKRIAFLSFLLFIPALCAGQSPVRFSKDTINIHNQYSILPVWLYNASPETLSIDSIFSWCNFIPSEVALIVNPININLRDLSYRLDADTDEGLSYAVRFRIEPHDSVALDFAVSSCSSPFVAYKDTLFALLVFKNRLFIDSIVISTTTPCPSMILQKLIASPQSHPINGGKHHFDCLGRKSLVIKVRTNINSIFESVFNKITK